MSKAIELALRAKENDEVPIGALIVLNDIIIATSSNTKERYGSAIHHAEIEAIEKATRYLGTWHLDDCELYVTLEPCMMCTGAIVNSRIKKVFFGAYNPKGGALVSNINLLSIKGLNHYPLIEGGIKEEECAMLLSDFFKEKRKR